VRNEETKQYFNRLLESFCHRPAQTTTDFSSGGQTPEETCLPERQTRIWLTGRQSDHTVKSVLSAFSAVKIAWFCKNAKWILNQ
jgi:hypothetical protein